MKENFQSQKGLTLVEILVSIVLLGIILTSFMGFFTQSALFTKKNENKLGTMQTAQKYISLIEEVSKEELSNYSLTKDLTKKVILDSKDKIDALILPDEPIKSSYNIQAEFTTKDTDSTIPDNLIKIKLIIKDPNDVNNMSITYTYISRK
ncbi:hypothetical protein BABA_18282 [Neobacillus bataviensis LMG 21833]|uniref:Prepilin-type N-terminal cleavage/methylation domain-containing protein n=1 Tax=Neobacillus bataviensis LMG 21833 TaxID=1117379 RepID=K6DC33_9BACI|nr:type II secretion system protein [Neobacillus bataviensis]EKN65869.1 hypothetical protein BABA_18282 [Neobacillus bataviensis LMG 21833]